MDLLARARSDLRQPAVPVARDAFLPIATAVIVLLAQWTDPGSPAELLALAPAAAALGAVGLGVRLPLEAVSLLVIASVAGVVGHRGNLEGALFLPVMATLYAAWHLGSTIRSTVVAACAAVAPVVVAEALVPEGGIVWTPWAAANAFTFAMGLTLRGQRRLIRQLEEAREALAEQAVGEERRRIARELHDLAGHTLAAMVLHVTGARHVLGRDPEEAARALQDAEDVGRRSLDEIRATVAALRDHERGTDPALPRGLDVGDVVATYRRAGLDVTVDGDGGPPVEVAGPVAAAVHRIVQESLANVARHAPANRAVVAVRVAGRAVTVDVHDHGRRPAPSRDDTHRFGVLGMRERARALGGDLAAGPHDDGWQVRARIPLTGTPNGSGAP